MRKMELWLFNEDFSYEDFSDAFVPGKQLTDVYLKIQ